jgi:hypothetical protein
MKKILILSAVFLSQFAYCGDLFPDGKPPTMAIGDKIDEGSTIGGYPIWNGENKWRYLASAKWDTSGATASLGQITAFQTENKQLVAVMVAEGNLTQAQSSGWTDEPCKRDDYLFKASLGGKFSNVNCVTINHITGYPGNVGGKDAEAFSFFKTHEVETPPTVIRMTFTRYTSNMRRYVVKLTINPEIMGFKREPGTVWGQNPWHKSQALLDPEKKKFVEDLGVWAGAFAGQMDAAFEKKPDAFKSISSWRQDMRAGVKAEVQKAAVTLD